MKLAFISTISTSVRALLLPALLIGVVTAFACICFHLLIEFFITLFFGVEDGATFNEALTALTTLERILIPTIGGLLVGGIITFLQLEEAKGEGVPQVLKAITQAKSKIRFLVAPIKIVTTAITLGSGGSAGREGPIVQIGSAIGSSIGQVLKKDESTTRLFLAAGAAAGIGGTFGAPLAGILFSLELIIKKINPSVLIPIASAAFLSDYLASTVLGYSGLRLIIPDDFTLTPTLFLWAIFLGATAGLVALYFGSSIRFVESVFAAVSVPLFAKTAIGGFLIGILGLFFPYIHEPATYPLMIDLLTTSNLPLLFLIGVVIAKITATSITLGSGGSGGILAPALLTGLVFGYLTATLFMLTGLSLEAHVIAFGLMGMAGVFAGVTHAPWMAAVLLYEVTGEPLILPLVLVSAFMSYRTAKYFYTDSVYTEHLSKRRIV